MFIINTTTKKFTEAAELDLGMLPAQVKIDFALSDGSEPVEAENHRFKLTIGDVVSELYKTDEDTVSFRYVPFDSDTVAATKAITIEMDGEQILSDTIALTYSEPGGGNPLPSGGVAGQVLTKTSEGEAWDDVPSELPATGTDGNFLQKTASGAQWTAVPAQEQADWSESSSASPAFIKNKPDLSVYVEDSDLSGINTEIQEYTEAIKSKLSREPVCFTALVADTQLKIFEYANNNVELTSTTFQYSTDKVNWSNLVVNDTFNNTEPFFTFSNIGDKVYLRHVGPIGNFPAYGGLFAICSLPSNPQIPNVNVSGDLMSLIDGNSFITSDTIPYPGLINVFTWVWGRPSLDFNGAYIDVDTIGDWGLQNFIGYSTGMHYPVIKANHLGTEAMKNALSGAANLTTYDFLITNDLEQCQDVLSNCANLNDLTVHFTAWPEGGITGWLSGVSATGTFRCPAALDTTNRGANYIPEGWTIETF